MSLDHRSRRARAAWARALAAVPPQGRALAVGGGQRRPAPGVWNLDLDPTGEVDVVADAHALPIAGASLDLVACEATLEHLRHPARAMAELARVLRPGGHAYTVVPFLQAYHPVPEHYSNVSLPGHRALHEDAGLEVLDSGASHGPVRALVDLAYLVFTRATPRPLRPLLTPLLGGLRGLVLPMDRWVHDRDGAHVAASATYVLSRKPG